MELRTATAQELKTAYNRDLKASFPPAELRSLHAIDRLVADGGYDPLVLAEDGEILGECFLWLGVPGWVLIDYLCVAQGARNRGLGARMLALLKKRLPGWVILAESEDPVNAPDPALAARRLAFYDRAGAKTAAWESDVFGVRYKVLFWAETPVDGETLLEQYRFIYTSCFSPAKFKWFMSIPAVGAPRTPMTWEE